MLEIDDSVGDVFCLRGGMRRCWLRRNGVIGMRACCMWVLITMVALVIIFGVAVVMVGSVVAVALIVALMLIVLEFDVIVFVNLVFSWVAVSGAVKYWV